MSRNISHNISAALGLRLPFNAGSGLTYDAADPDNHLHKPVKISADRTVVLCADNDTPIGSIVLVEPSDRVSTKVTVEMGPVVRFNLGTGVTASTLINKRVVADGAGGVKLAGAGAVGFGVVTAVENGVVFVLANGTVVPNS